MTFKCYSEISELLIAGKQGVTKEGFLRLKNEEEKL